ncbi:MAG: hypothetical protein JWP77_2129 [Polaromonas sp.]|nr:hypothetical protein [Polaromonas sp.]
MCGHWLIVMVDKRCSHFAINLEGNRMLCYKNNSCLSLNQLGYS